MGGGGRGGPDGIVWLLVMAGLVSLGGLWWFAGRSAQGGAADFGCGVVRVLDGDTFDCDGRRVRLAGIDAPELPGHCREGRDCTPGDPFAATRNLERIVAFARVECRGSDIDVYGRVVARCRAGRQDLSCRQIADGVAVRRYGWIWCRGED
jgi:endonuclease YncB( thermonuclease family)